MTENMKPQTRRQTETSNTFRQRWRFNTYCSFARLTNHRSRWLGCTRHSWARTEERPHSETGHRSLQQLSIQFNISHRRWLWWYSRREVTQQDQAIIKRQRSHREVTNRDWDRRLHTETNNEPTDRKWRYETRVNDQECLKSVRP